MSTEFSLVAIAVVDGLLTTIVTALAIENAEDAKKSDAEVFRELLDSLKEDNRKNADGQSALLAMALLRLSKKETQEGKG